ncbi:MAG: DUF362 domain-containing protein [Oscillospiraceae bacterium]|nr:DUF362 domain-containing protein [Oscillospiraceae bacterium]
MKYDVSIVSCPDYSQAEEALIRVFEPIGGLDWVEPNMKIAVKVNLVTAMKPDTAGTTHPALVCALTKLLVQRGAQVIIGDSPGGIYNSVYLNRVYSVTGMREAEAFGAALNDNFEQSNVTFPEAKVLKNFTCTSWLLEADAIIDFCKLKSHGMMGMSGAVKNMFGAIPGTMKPEYHYKYPNYTDFADMLVDLNEYFKPRLAIVDAVWGMEGNGPTAGKPRHIGALLASFSTYKLDTACAALIGLDKDKVPTLEAAVRRGLAPADHSELNIVGPLAELTVPDFDHVAVHNSLLFAGNGKNPLLRAFSAVGGKLLISKPKLHAAECVGCGVCAGICPAKAIVITNKLAVIDKSKCIRCFCCQEFCPKGAMKVKRPLAARIAAKL